jgi:hypothetical protein
MNKTKNWKTKTGKVENRSNKLKPDGGGIPNRPKTNNPTEPGNTKPGNKKTRPQETDAPTPNRPARIRSANTPPPRGQNSSATTAGQGLRRCGTQLTHHAGTLRDGLPGERPARHEKSIAHTHKPLTNNERQRQYLYRLGTLQRRHRLTGREETARSLQLFGGGSGIGGCKGLPPPPDHRTTAPGLPPFVMPMGTPTPWNSPRHRRSSIGAT